MILETVRIMTDALADGSYGVNVKLAAIPIDVGDDAAPPVAVIGDITRDRWAAELMDPPKIPALLVAPAGPGFLKGEVLAGPIRLAETIPIDVIYIGRDVDSQDALAHMMLTFRAVLQTLRDLMGNDQADDRVRNNVCVVSAKDVTWGLAEMPLESAGATGALTVSFEVRDTDT